ncbi:MAG TPA: hypothetical protein PK727_04680 [Bacteroidales bacterium]|jgi:hypothetical protein|nr:hypothetical protein [Bacteroidales bacterium]
MDNQLELPLPVTREEFCMMCHLSSGCAGCCIICKNKNCDKPQACGINNDPIKSIGRLRAWQAIVKNCTSSEEREHHKKLLSKNWP